MTFNDLDPDEVLYDLLSANATIYGDDSDSREGYIVGLRQYNLRIGRNLQNMDMDKDLVARWLEEILPAISKGNTIGSWHDTETGDLHIDVGMIYPELEFALDRARLEGELAIWDIARGAEIRVARPAFDRRN